MLHINDLVFRPNDDRNEEERREPISTKKLSKGDASWSTYKTILGWVIDTLRGTIELPPHQKERLMLTLTDALRQSHVSELQLHKLLGELRSMMIAISSGSSLLSQLHHDLA